MVVSSALPRMPRGHTLTCAGVLWHLSLPCVPWPRNTNPEVTTTAKLAGAPREPKIMSSPIYSGQRVPLIITHANYVRWCVDLTLFDDTARLELVPFLIKFSRSGEHSRVIVIDSRRQERVCWTSSYVVLISPYVPSCWNSSAAFIFNLAVLVRASR